MADTTTHHYAVLGVPTAASAAEIVRAYRRQLRRLHPDTRDADAVDGANGADGADALVSLYEAFRVLGDPRRRAAYDHTLSGSASRAGPASSTPRRSPGTASYLGDPPDPPLRAGPVRYQGGESDA